MTSAIYGHDLAPAVLADEKGNVVRVESAASPEWLERLLRPVRLLCMRTSGQSSFAIAARQCLSEAAQHQRQAYVLQGGPQRLQI